jgi:hypothetical protein
MCFLPAGSAATCKRLDVARVAEQPPASTSASLPDGTSFESQVGRVSTAAPPRESGSVNRRSDGRATTGGRDLNPRPLGYEPYDARLFRLRRSPWRWLTSADGINPGVLSPPGLPLSLRSGASGLQIRLQVGAPVSSSSPVGSLSLPRESQPSSSSNRCSATSFTVQWPASVGIA